MCSDSAPDVLYGKVNLSLDLNPEVRCLACIAFIVLFSDF